jgi:hypothetical protein
VPGSTGPLRDRRVPAKQGMGAFAQLSMEPMTGIEPAYSAWEVDSTIEQTFCPACSEALAAN